MASTRPGSQGTQFSGDAVAELLGGRRSYDDLDDASQALVRHRWRQEIDGRLSALDLGAEFEAEDTPYAELVEGTVVVR